MAPKVNTGWMYEIASDTELSRNDLKSVIENIRSQTPLLEFVEEAWKESSLEIELIYRNPPSDYVFIISDSKWRSIVEAAELDNEEAKAAKRWQTKRAKDLLLNVRRPNSVKDDEVYLVISLPAIEPWREAKEELSLWFGELAKEGLTPAEFIDYWVTEQSSYTPAEWATERGVSTEAVTKNSRQARQKLADSYLRPL